MRRAKSDMRGAACKWMYCSISLEELDDVGINVGAEESISASGSEAVGSNISGEKLQLGAKECHSSGDILGFYKRPVWSQVVAAEWCSGSSAVGVKVKDVTGENVGRSGSPLWPRPMTSLRAPFV